MKRLVLLLAVTLAVLAGTGCANNALNAAPVDTDRVEMPKSYKFAPAVIRVKVGTTVTWHNDDNFTHSVQVVGSSDPPKVAQPGQSVQLTFDKPGEFNYICTFHPNDMKGKVIVTGTSLADASADGASN